MKILDIKLKTVPGNDPEDEIIVAKNQEVIKKLGGTLRSENHKFSQKIRVYKVEIGYQCVNNKDIIITEDQIESIEEIL